MDIPALELQLDAPARHDAEQIALKGEQVIKLHLKDGLEITIPQPEVLEDWRNDPEMMEIGEMVTQRIAAILLSDSIKVRTRDDVPLDMQGYFEGMMSEFGLDIPAGVKVAEMAGELNDEARETLELYLGVLGISLPTVNESVAKMWKARIITGLWDARNLKAAAAEEVMAEVDTYTLAHMLHAYEGLQWVFSDVYALYTALRKDTSESDEEDPARKIFDEHGVWRRGEFSLQKRWNPEKYKEALLPGWKNTPVTIHREWIEVLDENETSFRCRPRKDNEDLDRHMVEITTLMGSLRATCGVLKEILERRVQERDRDNEETARMTALLMEVRRAREDERLKAENEVRAALAIAIQERQAAMTIML